MNEQTFGYVILRKQGVFVYKLPARESDGYRAELWKDPIWSGRLHVACLEDKCIIRLLESSSDSLFARCVVAKDIDRAVERAADSSRYFVLRLDDGRGRHSFVGIGFSNRNDAFDFICAIHDFHQEETSLSIEPEKIQNLALSEAEPVKIEFKNIHPKPNNSNRIPHSSASSSIIPPPSSITANRCIRQKRSPKGVRSGDQSLPSENDKKSEKVNRKNKTHSDAFEIAFGEKKTKPEIKGEEKDDANRAQHTDAAVLLDVWDAFSDEAVNADQREIINKNNPFADDTDDDK